MRLDLQKQSFKAHNFWPQIIFKVEMAMKYLLYISYLQDKSLTKCSSTLCKMC